MGATGNSLLLDCPYGATWTISFRTGFLAEAQWEERVVG